MQSFFKARVSNDMINFLVKTKTKKIPSPKKKNQNFE